MMNEKYTNSSLTKFLALSMALLLMVLAMPATAEESTDAPEASGVELVWETDYAAATQRAEREQKLLLIHFFNDEKPASSAGFLKEAEQPEIREKLSNFVLARLSADAEVSVKGEPVKLLDHKAFAELEHRQGIVVIDYANEESEQYGYVVSVLPFHSGKYYRYNPHHLAVILDLPPGTLTQRSMVFAVRIHPEAPASTTGDLDPNLVSEAKKHSEYQASIRVQGHHQWDYRFPRIRGLLSPSGLVPQEVVAESWPHENLLDAAVDCVHSWRQSPGHWGAVKRDQPKFGYDMRRGTNGIWYATGIFGNRH